MSLLVASVAGSLGAVARYVLSGVVQTRSASGFPFGTLAVNLSGSFCLGLVVGAGSLDSWLAMSAIGFLGGFTTFSTFMVESIRLGTRSTGASINLMGTIVGGVLVAAVGYILTG